MTVDRPEEPAEEQGEPAADCLDRVCQELIRSVRPLERHSMGGQQD